jgi:S-formylglutathione hydrolase FrmB
MHEPQTTGRFDVTVHLDVSAEGVSAGDASGADVARIPERAVMVVSWLGRAEAEAFRQSGHLTPAAIVPFVARSHVAVADRDRLSREEGMSFPLRAPVDSDAVPIAVFDIGQAFWPTVMGAAGKSLIGFGSTAAGAGGRRVTLARSAPVPAHRSRFECTGARFDVVNIAGTGEGGPREACAYLPASYRRHPQRKYPVVYLLPGLGGDDRVRFSDTGLLEHADELGRRLGQEAILVGVDTRSPHGSAYFTRRSISLLTRTVDAVDARLRTVTSAAGRALLGQSTGGFNAISAALLAPHLFGAVAASAPDALDFEAWLLGADGRLREPWLAWMRLENAVGGAGQMLSYGESWGVDGASPAEWWPAKLETGQIKVEVLEAWLSHSPLRMIQTAEGKAALAAASGKIFISSSKNDEFGLFEPARRFSEELGRMGTVHEFVADEGGHFEVHGRLASLLGRLLAVVTPASG